MDEQNNAAKTRVNKEWDENNTTTISNIIIDPNAYYTINIIKNTSFPHDETVNVNASRNLPNIKYDEYSADDVVNVFKENYANDGWITKDDSIKVREVRLIGIDNDNPGTSTSSNVFLRIRAPLVTLSI